jgi:mRNA interferase RelE/StbE
VKRSLYVPDHCRSLIKHLHPHLKTKVKAALSRLLADSSVGKALKDELAGLRSFRIGDWRIVYRLRGKLIEIIAIGPRRTIYQETYRLLQKED